MSVFDFLVPLMFLFSLYKCDHLSSSSLSFTKVIGFLTTSTDDFKKMQGFITRDLYPNTGSQGGAQINAATTQRGEPDKTGQGYGKKSDFRCMRKPKFPEKTCEVGYGSATKLTYEQRDDPGYRTRSAVVRGECFDHYTSPTSLLDFYQHLQMNWQ